MAAAVLLVLAVMLAPRGAAEAATLVLDPGHGGYDSGITAPGFMEKDIVLVLARRIEASLNGSMAVVLTRSTDAYTSLDARREVILNGASPKALISLHATSAPEFAVYTAAYPQGFESAPPAQRYGIHARQFAYLAQSRLLASAFAGRLAEQGVKLRELPALLLGDADCPAVLVEVPVQILKDASKLDELAGAITGALDDFEKSSMVGR